MKMDKFFVVFSLMLGASFAQVDALAKTTTPIGSTQLLADAAADDKEKDKGPSFSGNASWYGIPFHGKKTASGEIFDMNKLSAAHKTLPFPTKVMVENPKNGQACVIRVIDRGPFVRGRILDLSREAAKRVGIFPGVGYVEATVLTSKAATQVKK
ncbi:MAG TPA: septal ring lytic transglycosylase RlpA family protein [Drouetiella sp.]|jgi:rare lipoprotein A (peptidoglycan hydrolase)